MTIKNSIDVKRSSSSIIKANNNIGNFSDERKLLDDLEIKDINTGILDQSGTFAWWAALAAAAKRRADESKENVRIVEARKSQEVRNRISGEGGKSTEGVINAEVMASIEYEEAVSRKIRDYYNYDLLEVAVESMRHRKDCLIALAANSRQEMASGITMNSANAALSKRAARKSNKVSDDD
jgi:hypothetical protein